MKILLVDDNHEIRRLIKSLIAEIADDIYECDDGAKAFEIYAAHLPDLVLMDVYMNKMDGLTAMKSIRKVYPQSKIIVVTNHSDKRTRQAAAETGADAFFGKDDLLALISFLNAKEF